MAFCAIGVYLFCTSLSKLVIFSVNYIWVRPKCIPARAKVNICD